MSKKFKIGIISDLLQLPFRESLKVCSSLGADGIQLYAADGELSPENLSKSQRKERKVLIQGYGLEISALCGDMGGHGFTQQNENIYKIEKSKRIVDLALDLGVNIITTHIGVIPEDISSKKYDILQKACYELALFACSYGATFAIETGPEPACRLRKFLDSLGSKGVAVNFDPANLVMVTDEDPIAAVHILKDYIVHTHAKDGIMLRKTDPSKIYDYFAEGGISDARMEDYFIEVPLGKGSVNYDSYLLALHEIGYNGYLTVEREVGDNPVADIAKAVEYLAIKNR